MLRKKNVSQKRIQTPYRLLEQTQFSMPKKVPHMQNGESVSGIVGGSFHSGFHSTKRFRKYETCREVVQTFRDFGKIGKLLSI